MSLRTFAMLLASMYVGSVQAHDSDEEALVLKLEQSARDPLLNLDAHGLLDRFAEDIYVLRSDRPPSKTELSTAARMARDTGYKILILSHFPRLGHVPVVDAIAFDRRARPVANLSFKTVAAGSAHPPRAASDMIESFRKSLRNNYRAAEMRAAISALRTPRALNERAFISLVAMLGLHAARPRPIWLAVDFTLQGRLAFVVDDSPRSGLIIRFFDASGEPYRNSLHRSLLRRRTHDIWLLFEDATVRVCESELKITLFP